MPSRHEVLTFNNVNLDAPRQAVPKSRAWIGKEFDLRWSACRLVYWKLRAEAKMIENLGDGLGLGNPGDDLSMASAVWASMDIFVEDSSE